MLRIALRFIEGPLAGQVQEAEIGPKKHCLIGRDPEAHIYIPETERTVSAKHAKIVMDGPDIVINDVGSKYGTFINEKAMPRALLRGGEHIRLGVRGPVAEFLVLPAGAAAAPGAGGAAPQRGGTVPTLAAICPLCAAPLPPDAFRCTRCQGSYCRPHFDPGYGVCAACGAEMAQMGVPAFPGGVELPPAPAGAGAAAPPPEPWPQAAPQPWAQAPAQPWPQAAPAGPPPRAAPARRPDAVYCLICRNDVTGEPFVCPGCRRGVCPGHRTASGVCTQCEAKAAAAAMMAQATGGAPAPPPVAPQPAAAGREGGRRADDPRTGRGERGRDGRVEPGEAGRLLGHGQAPPPAPAGWAYPGPGPGAGAAQAPGGLPPDEKLCPFCAERIKAAAVKCRHCGEFLDGRAR